VRSRGGGAQVGKFLLQLEDWCVQVAHLLEPLYDLTSFKHEQAGVFFLEATFHFIPGNWG